MTQKNKWEKELQYLLHERKFDEIEDVSKAFFDFVAKTRAEAVSDAMRELKGKCEKDERFESGSQKKGEGFIYLQTLTELINKYIGGEK